MIASATTTGQRLERLHEVRDNLPALLDIQQEWIGHRDHMPDDTADTIYALLLEYVAACEGAEVMGRAALDGGYSDEQAEQEPR